MSINVSEVGKDVRRLRTNYHVAEPALSHSTRSRSEPAEDLLEVLPRNGLGIRVDHGKQTRVQEPTSSDSCKKQTTENGKRAKLRP